MNDHEEKHAENDRLLDEMSGVKGWDQEKKDDLKEKLDKQEVHRYKCKGKWVLRRKRVPLSLKTKERLEQAFVSGIVPRGRHSRQAKEKLAAELDLTFEAVNKWFDNRRIKDSLQNKRLISFVSETDDQPKQTVGSKRTIDEMTAHGELEHQVQHENDHLDSTISVQLLHPSQHPLPPQHPQDSVLQVSSSSSSAVGVQLEGFVPTKKSRRENVNLGAKLELNNFSSAEPVIPEHVRESFRIIKSFLLGNVDLWNTQAVIDPTGGLLIDHEDLSNMSSTFSRKIQRKRSISPTLANVFENTLSKGGVFFPLIQAIQTVAGNGASNALFALVENQEQSFRTLLVWYAIGKYSGHKTCEFIFKSLTNGLKGSLTNLAVTEQLREFFPALIGKIHEPEKSHSAMFASESSSWSEKFIMELLYQHPVSVNGMKGSIVEVLPPEKDSHQPRFKVAFPEGLMEYSWETLKDSVFHSGHDL